MSDWQHGWRHPGDPDYSPAPGALTLRLGRAVIPVRDYAEASERFGRIRDENGHGASTMPRGRVFRDGRAVAEVSYNGRVWEGERCAFDPYAPAGG